MIVAIVGPTGVGKTKMSVELAKMLDAVIINCDAVQVYKDLNIGSAKATLDEQEGVPHYLLDFKDINEEYTVKDYQQDLRMLLEKYKNRNIVIVGGTGLYLCAGLMDYRFEDEGKHDLFENLSNEQLYNMALEKNPNVDIHPNNRVRLIRFLNRQTAEKVEPVLLYPDVYFIGLTTPRDNLYEIINNRVDKMVDNGLLEEVQKLYKEKPNSRVLNSAIGYKELIDYIKGNVTLDAAISNIKQNSRHYAKRQYTWFNNKMNVTWFDVDYNNFNNTIKEVKNYLIEK